MPLTYKRKKIFKFGESGSGLKIRGTPQDFYVLRDHHLRTNTLFVDPQFPPNRKSLGDLSNRHELGWARATEISSQPRFFIDGVDRFDVIQGQLGDCWMLAALANITLVKTMFETVVPTDQHFTEKYAGIFHFRFWQYGVWIDVVIDDYIPIIKSTGKIAFLQSHDSNEFWSALLEKAYAKINGSYGALDGGFTRNALEDFTGGLSEVIHLDEKIPPNLYQMLHDCYKKFTLMSCNIQGDELEGRLDNGLIMLHAYSVTKLAILSDGTKLIRLRNPWGDDSEWNGPWSDESPEWDRVSDDEKRKLKFKNDKDGEFWMSFDDFTYEFTDISLCHLSPVAASAVDIHINAREDVAWSSQEFNGVWTKGISAGGQRYYMKTYDQNPQYFLAIPTINDDEEDDTDTTIVISLMQKLAHIRAEPLAIAFELYEIPICKVCQSVEVTRPIKRGFFETHKPLFEVTYKCKRQIGYRSTIRPGVYCVVPSTYEPNTEGKFLLRVFFPRGNIVIEYDEKSLYNKQIMREDEKEEEETRQIETDNDIQRYFDEVTGGNVEINDEQLKIILNNMYRNEIQKIQFSIDACRSMIVMLDDEISGRLSYYQFRRLMVRIKKYRDNFVLYNKSKLGHLDFWELNKALKAQGHTFNKNILTKLIHRYSFKNEYIEFASYIVMSIRLVHLTDLYRRNKTDRKTTELNYAKWMDYLMYI